MPTPPTPILIRGIRYPSMAAAARKLGVSSTTVFNALERGTLDRVGLGIPAYKTNSIPVTIRGVTYASQCEAARQLGVKQNTIALAYKRGTLDKVGLRKAKMSDPKS